MTASKHSKIIPAILIGGSGTRLWPLSTEDKPKQFLRLFGKHSLFQNTVLRLSQGQFEKPWLLTHADLISQAQNQIKEMDFKPAGILVEPERRGTAAAIAAAAFVLKEHDPNAVMLVTPADHVVKDTAAFCDCLMGAAPYAMNGKIVTLGIVPTEPSTEFGYIKAGDEITNDKRVKAHQVSRGGFLEKPDVKLAQQFYEAGSCFWNAGIFLFSPRVILEELKTYSPQIFDAAKKAFELSEVTETVGVKSCLLNKDSFAKAPNTSIDYAIMEHSDKIVVVPASFDWADVGSFEAIERVRKNDTENNHTKK